MGLSAQAWDKGGVAAQAAERECRVREQLEQLQQTVILGSSARTWLVSVLLLVLGVLLGRLVKWLLRRYGSRLANFTSTDLDDALIAGAAGPLGALVPVAAGHVVIHLLRMPDGTRELLLDALVVAAATVLVVMLLAWVDAVFEHFIHPLREKTRPGLDRQVVDFGRRFTRIAVIIGALLTVMQTVGLDVMSLVTGLGIGGLAVALAAQEALGNVLGSIQVMADQPYAIGDFIRVNDLFGRVEELGLRSTRLLTPDGVRVVVPNRLLAQTPIQNCSAHEGITEAFNLGLTYDTPGDRVEEAAALLRRIIAAQPNTADAVTVHFVSFGDFSLNLRIVYFHTDFDAVPATRHAVNVAIKKAFDDAELAFAFPTQTLHLGGEAPGQALRLGS